MWLQQQRPKAKRMGHVVEHSTHVSKSTKFGASKRWQALRRGAKVWLLGERAKTGEAPHYFNNKYPDD